jgi:hypothetical protein
MRKLKHPIAVFIIGVCCVIALGVVVLAATGNGGLSSSLTCAPVTASEYGPPGARFTANFTGPVFLVVPNGYVDKAPYYEVCAYEMEPHRDSSLTWGVVSVRTYPGSHISFKSTANATVTPVKVGTNHGQQILFCSSKSPDCVGWMVVNNRRYQWFVQAGGTNARVVQAFLRSFLVTGN